MARDLEAKYKDKEDLEDALVKMALRPLDKRAYANFYANPGSSFEGKNYTLQMHKRKIGREEGAKEVDTPDWLKWTSKDKITAVLVMKKGKTQIVVTGDANRNKVLTVPGGSAATVKIELPKNWDVLMKDLGYKPLKAYSVATDRKPAAVAKNNGANKGNVKQKRPSPEKYREILKNKK